MSFDKEFRKTPESLEGFKQGNDISSRSIQNNQPDCSVENVLEPGKEWNFRQDTQLGDLYNNPRETGDSFTKTVGQREIDYTFH